MRRSPCQRLPDDEAHDSADARRLWRRHDAQLTTGLFRCRGFTQLHLGPFLEVRVAPVVATATRFALLTLALGRSLDDA